MNGLALTLQAFTAWLEDNYDIILLDGNDKLSTKAIGQLTSAYEDYLSRAVIYVDEIRRHPPLGEYWCHLWTEGDAEALHQVALKIGVGRSRFFLGDDLVDFPHYRLGKSLRGAALAKHINPQGAKEVRLREYLLHRQAGWQAESEAQS